MQIKYDALINTSFGAIALSQYRAENEYLAIELLTQSGPNAGLHIADSALLQTAYQQIQAYLAQPTTPLTLPNIQHGTAFQQRVWRAICDIPIGQTKTYGQLARLIGSGPRAVANACGANTLPILIPCHRVVAQTALGGFMQSKPDGLRIKQWLLQHEGHVQYG